MDALTLALAKKYTDKSLPCYDNRQLRDVVIEWDGNTANRETMDVDLEGEIFTAIKLSDEYTTDTNCLVGGEIELTWQQDGETNTLSVPIVEDMMLDSGEFSCIGVEFGVVLFAKEGERRGTWYAPVAPPSYGYMSKLTCTMSIGEFKQLAPELLPNNSVGKILVYDFRDFGYEDTKQLVESGEMFFFKVENELYTLHSVETTDTGDNYIFANLALSKQLILRADNTCSANATPTVTLRQVNIDSYNGGLCMSGYRLFIDVNGEIQVTKITE